ncbi:MAG: hypothetical protein JNN13_07645, partial [Planctomycetes bacterium]|nr:hypothetical protein [Planctomycetota bacterium]
MLLQTERIEHGRGAPSGHVAERALLLRQLTALAAGDYWVVERSVADRVALVLPQFADPRTLAWQQYELPNVHGQPRTLVFPLDQRPAALA